MLNLVIGNLRNFQSCTRVSIVVLTLIAWAAIVTSVHRAFSGPPIKTWHSWLTFSFYKPITAIEPTATEQNMKQKVKLSTYSILVSTLGIAILIGVIFLEFKQNHETAGCFGLTGLAFLIVMALIYAPLSISVNDESLNVNRIIFKKSIPLSEIKSAELCPPSMAERRIFASGGWLGYWGKCYEPSIGKYFAYYGKASDCFLIKLKDGRQYLLGCENPSSIVDYIKSKIK